MALLSRRAGRAVLLLPLALHLAGCLREEVIEPFTETIAVHGIVQVGSATVGIALARVAAGRPEVLNGAQLTLTRASGSSSLVQLGMGSSFCFAPAEETPRFQCYGSVLATPIEPGEAIALEVVLPDGERISGRTVTPSRPAITTPETDADVHTVAYFERFGGFGFSVEFEPVEVRWSGADDRPGDVFLRVGELLADDQSLPCVGFDEWPEFTRSPAHVQPPGLCPTEGEDVMWDSAHVDVFVTAYDPAATSYLASFEEIGAGIVLGGASPGLDVESGDVLLTGVFGSAARAFVPITLHATVVERD